MDGRLPYEDFFFTQMPLLPFVYAGARPALSSNPPDGSTAIEVPLPAGRPSFRYLFGTRDAARKAAPDIARLLASGGGAASRIGAVVVGHLAPPSERQTRILELCASRAEKPRESQDSRLG